MTGKPARLCGAWVVAAAADAEAVPLVTAAAAGSEVESEAARAFALPAAVGNRNADAVGRAGTKPHVRAPLAFAVVADAIVVVAVSVICSLMVTAA